MSASATATQARRGSWGEVMAVVAIILGMLAGFGVITAAPASAAYLGDTECADLGHADDSSGNQQAEFFGLVLEFGGVDNGTIDDGDKDAYLPVAEADATYLSTEALSGATEVDYCFTSNTDIVLLVDGNPVFHISCSQPATGTVDGYGDVTDFWLDQRLGNPDGKDYCTRGLPDIPVDPVASLSAGECEFDEDSTYPVAYSLTVNDGEGPFSLFVDGVEDTTVTLTEGVDQPLGDFAPGTALEIREGSSVLASISVADATCPPDPDPVPAITLEKSPVVGEGSDLLDEDPNPLLQFSDSDSDEDAQTALYSYLITNTGDEPLINLSLEDTRIAEADLDLSACPEVLEVGDSCTATGSEDFTLADAEADEDGLVTNTGTVKGTGQESEQEVTASDDATIALSIVFPQAPLEKEDPKPAPDVKSDAQEQPAPEVESAAEELPATGLDREGLLPLSLLLMAIGGALLWLDRPWVGVR